MSGEGSSSQDVDHFPGQYQFTVHPGLQDENDENQCQKSVAFTFSKKLSRLYVKRLAVCPFGIHTLDTPPANSVIKIIVFAEDNVPVMSCPAHTGDNNQHYNLISPHHFLKSENPSATYHCCEDTGKLSILLPYIKLESVAENVENFIFLCSSQGCIKKNLFIKFCLMNSNKILGHHIFGLHVCSTPGRDRRNHEAGKTNKKRKRPVDPECSAETVLPPSEQTYHILIKKPWIADYLLPINRGLELLEAMTVEEQEFYLNRKRANQAAASQRASSTCTATSSSNTRTTLRRILVKS